MQNTGDTVEVAIIGAGIIGLAIAERLLASGTRRVGLYEQTGIGAGASGVQPGGVRAQWGTALNCQLAVESIAFYRELGSRLAIASPPVLEPCGYVFVAHDKATLTQLENALAIQHGHGISSRLLPPGEISEIVPGFQGADVLGAAYCADDGYFDKPQAVVEAFAAAALRRGAILKIAQVMAISQNGGGWDIQTADQLVTKAERVIVAAGHHSSKLLESGHDVPITAVPKYLFFSDPIRERLLEPLVVALDRHFAAKQLSNGRVLASDLSAQGDADATSGAGRGHVRACIEEMLPALAFVSFGLLVKGEYDLTPDHQPIIGPLDDEGTLWLVAGFSGHGFMIAPAVARIVTEALLQDRYDPALELLAVDRFQGGLIQPELQVV
jgi:sarcosine oxidase subunit beta